MQVTIVKLPLNVNVFHARSSLRLFQACDMREKASLNVRQFVRVTSVELSINANVTRCIYLVNLM